MPGGGRGLSPPGCPVGEGARSHRVPGGGRGLGPTGFPVGEGARSHR